jgi:hypothetical protein
MCWFITAYLPGTADCERAAAIFEAHHVGFNRIINPRVLSQLPSGDVFILTTSSGKCSCGTSLGSQAHGPAESQAEVDRQITTLRKRGWSSAKIGRWQEQKHMAALKRQRAEHSTAEHVAPQLTRWIELVTELLHSGTTERVGLLLHSGHDVEHGGFDIKRQEWIRLPDITVEHLLHLEAEVLYHYHA